MKGYVLDLDGVIYTGGVPVPGAREFIARIRASGKKVMFLSNASFCSRAAIAGKLRSMGIDCKDGEVINSGAVAAQYIKNRFGKCAVFAVGEQGLADELKAEGLCVQKPGARAVAVGIDRRISYAKIADALDCLRAGAALIACNSDPTYPVESNKILPGAGAMVGALEGCSGMRAELVGKPKPLMLRICLASMQLKPAEVAVVGDRLETDILMANKAGAFSILVLTGVSTSADLKKAKGLLRPKLVVKDLRGLEI